MRFYRGHLPTHGKGAYYSWALRRGNMWSRGVRVSIGGYGWDRDWWKPHYQRYRRIAVHMGVGPVCVSFLTGGLG